MNTKYLLCITILTAALMGCGGGKSDGDSVNSTIEGGLKGDWETSCISVDDSSLILHASHDIVDGKAFYGEGTTSYYTSDCSGSPKVSWKLGGAVSYNGEIATAICTAEKFDTTFSIIEIDGKTYTGNNFDTVMNQIGNLERKRSSLACIYKDNYLEGAGVPGARPNTVNPALVYYRSN